MKKIGLLMACGLAVPAVLAGIPGTAAASDENRVVRICNKANQTIQVANVSDQGDSLVSEGWYTYENGECSTLTGRFMYFEGADGDSWSFPGTYTSRFCVASDAFTIYSPASKSACKTSGGYMETFSSVPAGGGTYKFTMVTKPD